MAVQKDYYEVLGVDRSADAKAIQDAFRQLALKYHPDRNKEPGAAERFKEIAEAYAVLHDPKRRADYDARGHASLSGVSPEDLFAGIDFGDLFSGLGFDFPCHGAGLFDRFFRRTAEVNKGANIEVEVLVPLERIMAGGPETVQLRRPSTCATCRGTGAKPDKPPRTCAKCGGSGQLTRREVKQNVRFEQISTCPDCGGRGSFIDEPCRDCHGEGRIFTEETLTVNVPPGAEEGMALRVPGHGNPAPMPGGKPGDLFVVVRTRPDPRFRRAGSELWHTVIIEVPDAVLGTRREVPTLEGKATVEIPPATQPGAVLRLRGKGLPRFGSDRRGDLYVHIEVHVPSAATAKERELYEKLRDLLR